MYANTTIISMHLRMLYKRGKFFFNCFNAFPIKYILKKKNSFPKGYGNGNSLQCSCGRIPWTEEPWRLQSMGSKRVRHNSFYFTLGHLMCITNMSLNSLNEYSGVLFIYLLVLNSMNFWIINLWISCYYATRANKINTELSLTSPQKPV